MLPKQPISALNQLPQGEFKRTLAEIFEHSSWIPERTWGSKPFESIDQLHQTMVGVVRLSTIQEQLALLCAHPQLAGKEAKAGMLTNSSSEEQSSANLNSLSKAEVKEITRLNKEYQDKHGFPFIIAVKNHDKAGIFSEFKRRINNERNLEFTTALAQVAMIARFRLDALIEEHPNDTKHKLTD